jgi:two-component system, OmpR family, response regulator
MKFGEAKSAPRRRPPYDQREEVVALRVLVVEDAARLLEILTRRLRQEGYGVDGAATGGAAVRLAAAVPYDAIVLDIRLPDVDGFEVCRRVRAAGSWSSILMLTARDAVDDRVRALDIGADDYLTKPFEFPELFARIRALVRRGSARRPASLVVGRVVLDPAAHAAWNGEAALDLTAKEFALLEYFMRHPGQALTRGRLIEHVWDYAYQGDSNVVDVYVGRLRTKIDGRSGMAVLETVRGVGYRLREDPPAADVA